MGITPVILFHTNPNKSKFKKLFTNYEYGKNEILHSLDSPNNNSSPNPPNIRRRFHKPINPRPKRMDSTLEIHNFNIPTRLSQTPNRKPIRPIILRIHPRKNNRLKQIPRNIPRLRNPRKPNRNKLLPLVPRSLRSHHGNHRSPHNLKTNDERLGLRPNHANVRSRNSLGRSRRHRNTNSPNRKQHRPHRPPIRNRLRRNLRRTNQIKNQKNKQATQSRSPRTPLKKMGNIVYASLIIPIRKNII